MVGSQVAGGAWQVLSQQHALLRREPPIPFTVLWKLAVQVSTLVLDEADKLFSMGFTEQVDAVLAACTHTGIVRGLFSATLPEQVGRGRVAQG